VYEQIAANRRKTILLILGSVLFSGGIGFLIAYLLFRTLGGAVFGLVLFALLAGARAFYSYRFGDQAVLRQARAVPVTHEEEPRLHNIVEGLALAAGIPKPNVYVVPERAPNAFATGRNPEHSSVAVTRGLLDMMNRVELEGVVAHEMSHVRDHDILVGTVVATLVGTVVLLSEFMLRWMFWGGMTGRGRSRDGDGGSQGFMILAIVGVVLAVLAVIAAPIIQLAMSRRREYLADAQGAMLTRYPPGLASALRKIADDHTPMRVANNATAHLWLQQPSRIQGEDNHWWENLFSTHPPIQDRIRILEEM
jgi:heat shock protein HtpX